MAKPTEDLSWATAGGADKIQEPSAGQRLNGVTKGGTWTRKRTNWFFKAIGELSKWVQEDAMDLNENLSDLLSVETSRTNLGVLKAGIEDGDSRSNLQNDGRFIPSGLPTGSLINSSRASLGIFQGRNQADGTVVSAPGNMYASQRLGRGWYRVVQSRGINHLDVTIIGGAAGDHVVYTAAGGATSQTFQIYNNANVLKDSEFSWVAFE